MWISVENMADQRQYITLNNVHPMHTYGHIPTGGDLITHGLPLGHGQGITSGSMMLSSLPSPAMHMQSVNIASHGISDIMRNTSVSSVGSVTSLPIQNRTQNSSPPERHSVNSNSSSSSDIYSISSLTSTPHSSSPENSNNNNNSTLPVSNFCPIGSNNTGSNGGLYEVGGPPPPRSDSISPPNSESCDVDYQAVPTPGSISSGDSVSSLPRSSGSFSGSSSGSGSQAGNKRKGEIQ